MQQMARQYATQVGTQREEEGRNAVRSSNLQHLQLMSQCCAMPTLQKQGVWSHINMWQALVLG